ncbi:phosphatase PAP2 family protein [Agrococcus sp. SGAir0287]|uniref:phosphatase PAP2 family protein n=1 Tax=Agrococcus sp. SGAir0287 TaxID=2070347 RepID=UPI0020C7EF2E|nr:phosphatase PAP2 family protein [Agrococcus sp. SGAir0287]
MRAALVPDPDEVGATGERIHDTRVGEVDLTRWRGRAGEAAAERATEVARRRGPYAALALALLVAVAILAVATALVLWIYASITTDRGVAGLDQPILTGLIALRSPTLDVALTAVTTTAGTIGMPIIALVAMTTLALRRRSWTPVVLIATTGVVSVLLTIVGKRFIDRVRPPRTDAVPPFELSESFPSGHTLNAVAIVGVIAYLLILRRSSARARVAIALVAAAYVVVIGFTRVFLGHHWFTDVLAGLVLGVAWLALVITAHRLYLTVRARAST